MTRRVHSCSNAESDSGNYLSENQQRFSQADALTKVDTTISRDEFRQNVRRASSILFEKEK